MANENQEKDRVFFIPDNVFQQGVIWGFRIRNIVEGVIVAIVVFFLVSQVRFIFKIRMVVAFTLALGIGGFFVYGIRNRSVLEWLYGFIRFKLTAKRLHIRTPKQDRYRKVATTDENGERLAPAEILMLKIKNILKEKEGVNEKGRTAVSEKIEEAKCRASRGVDKIKRRFRRKKRK